MSFLRFWSLQEGCVCVALPAALQNLEKEHVPGILEHVPYVCYLCCLFFLVVSVLFTELDGFLIYISGLLLIFNIYFSVLGSPSRVRVCCAACGASEPSEKTRPWNFGACTLCVLRFLLFFVRFVHLFAGSGVSQQGACVMHCLRRFRTLRKNTSLEFWSMYPMGFIDFL